MNANKFSFIFHFLILSIFCIPCAFALETHPSNVSENTKSKRKPELEALRSQLESVDLQLKYLDVKVQDTREHVKQLEKKIEKQQTRINELQTTLNSIASESTQVTKRIESLTEAIAKEQARIAEIKRRFYNKIIYLHRMQQGTLVSSIFSSKDLNSFLTRFEMVKYLLQSDRELLKELGERLTHLEADKLELSEKCKRLDELASQTAEMQTSLETEANALSAMLQTLLLERKVFLNRQQKLKKSREALESEIRNAETKLMQNPNAFEKEIDASPTKRDSKSLNVRRSDQLQTTNDTAVRFRWPLANIDSLSFESTDSSTPPSLEIIVKGESEVIAAARGKVLFRGPVEQFGNIVILGHKNGFSTVYGRLDDVWVGIGEVVEAGDQIGSISGSKLHFEVRLAGKNVNPLPYLPKIK